MSQKVTQLTELTTLSPVDMAYVVDDPDGTPASRKITTLNLVKSGMGLTNTEQHEVRKVLHESTLTSSVRDVFVSGIPSGFDRLEITMLLRSTASITLGTTRMMFNGDLTDTNYRYLRQANLNGTDSHAQADDPGMAFYNGSNAPANNFIQIDACIVDYADTANHKVVRSNGGGRYDTTAMTSFLFTQNWESAAAITSIKIEDNQGGSWIANSYFKVVGVRTSG